MHSFSYIQQTFCNIHLFFTYFLLITSTKIAACIHRAPAKKRKKNYTKLTWIYRAIFHIYILTDYFSRVVSSKNVFYIVYPFFSFHIACNFLFYFMIVARILACFLMKGIHDDIFALLCLEGYCPYNQNCPFIFLFFIFLQNLPF